MENVIAIYIYHDASICIKIGNNYRIFEVERFTRQRYDTLINSDYEKIYSTVFDIIRKDYNIENFDVCLYIHDLVPEQKKYLIKLWKIKEFRNCDHHLAHAMGAFYLSGFNESLIISYDGGGPNKENFIEYFEVYYANKSKGELLYCSSIPLDLGAPYGVTAIPISEIHKTQNYEEKFLSFAGKLMGLSAYGKDQTDNLIPLKIFFKEKIGDPILLYEKFKKLKIGVNPLNLNINTLEAGLSYNLARASQQIFEEIFIEYTHGILSKNENIPLCLTGGCALNVLLNERIRLMYPKIPIFIPPNPNDCGLTFGMIVSEFPPNNVPIITYSGYPILDMNEFPNYIEKYKGKKIDNSGIIEIINSGKIVGLMYGNSECGPRALGNRSIICDPSISNMKDILNNKVKHREWFRPFAPVVQLEKASKYFEFNSYSSPYMSFASKIKKEYIGKFPAINHVDNTARLQTVTKKQHFLFYDLLTEYRKKFNKDILLNTSFNIKSKPILTRISDAIEILNTTKIDYVVIEDYIFQK